MWRELLYIQEGSPLSSFALPFYLSSRGERGRGGTGEEEQRAAPGEDELSRAGRERP